MSTDPLIGKQFGSYELKELLGRGGMAAVYRGYQAAIDRSVAVKVLPAELLADPHFSARFSNEARTLAKLTHPHILPLYDFGEANGMPYIVMPLMSQGTLADRLKAGPLTLAETVRVITAVAQGLDFANKQGILHRDIKPNNILFDQHDNPYLADFGIAKAMESSTSLTGTGIIGTPDYMSPEQARGDPLDHRSDLYSLGVVTYQCLTGSQLFRATTPMGVIFKHVSEAPRALRDLRGDIPEAVDKVVIKSLAKGPDERYASASEFARALARAAAEALSMPPAEGTAIHAEPPTQLHQPPSTGGWEAAGTAAGVGGTGSSFTLPPESVGGAAPAGGGLTGSIGVSEPGRSQTGGGFTLPPTVGGLAGGGAAPQAGNRNLLLIGGGVAAFLVVCCLGALAVWYFLLRDQGGGPVANPTPGALFTESFENGEGPWNTFDDGEVSRQLEDGTYIFRSSKTGWFTWDNPGESFEATRVEVTVRNTGADDASFGLMCHYQDDENYYY
ncbi:MAG: serine/threonine protein kinase, partial [Anaerolineales bacterium]|nr:serine/threonine protein kinase [Anaerolineales bacterium]